MPIETTIRLVCINGQIRKSIEYPLDAFIAAYKIDKSRLLAAQVARSR